MRLMEQWLANSTSNLMLQSSAYVPTDARCMCMELIEKKQGSTGLEHCVGILAVLISLKE